MIIEVMIVTGNVILLDQMFAKSYSHHIFCKIYYFGIQATYQFFVQSKSATFEARIRSVSLYIVKLYNNVVMASG